MIYLPGTSVKRMNEKTLNLDCLPFPGLLTCSPLSPTPADISAKPWLFDSNLVVSLLKKRWKLDH